jgi:AraC-like DNA-binding protein
MNESKKTEKTGRVLPGRPLTAEEIAVHPRFPEAEAIIARRLIALQDRSPRLVRLKSSHRKWLITHCLFALSSQREASDPLSGLTASRLIDIVEEIGAASRNTATAFLQEMLTYKFLREVPEIPDRRVRILEPTEISISGMQSWFDGHMEGLDLMDGGGRVAACAADPSLFRLAHMYAAARLVEDPVWREPRPCIALFVLSDAGGMILHDLITRLPEARREGDRLVIGPLSIAELAEHYAVSASNVKRMFTKVESAGLAGWSAPRRRGDFWISDRMLADYFHWQAAKFAALDAAIHTAVAERAGFSVSPWGSSR